MTVASDALFDVEEDAVEDDAVLSSVLEDEELLFETGLLLRSLPVKLLFELFEFRLTGTGAGRLDARFETLSGSGGPGVRACVSTVLTFAPMLSVAEA